MAKQCMKCGNGPRTGNFYCDTCSWLLKVDGRRPRPNYETLKSLGVSISNVEKQKREKIPYVLRVENWPEILQHTARLMKNCERMDRMLHRN